MFSNLSQRLGRHISESVFGMQIRTLLSSKMDGLRRWAEGCQREMGCSEICLTSAHNPPFLPKKHTHTHFSLYSLAYRYRFPLPLPALLLVSNFPIKFALLLSSIYQLFHVCVCVCDLFLFFFPPSACLYKKLSNWWAVLLFNYLGGGIFCCCCRKPPFSRTFHFFITGPL